MSNIASTETDGSLLQGDPLADNINAAAKSAPELAKSPGLTVGVAQAGGDVSGNAQAIARSTNAISDSNAHANVAAQVGGPDVLQKALDWFGNHVVNATAQMVSPIVQGAEKVGSSAMNVLNAPMRYVQHEYRYLHDVEATHGATAALLEGLGIAAAGVAGTLATGNLYGGVLASEGATAAEGQLFYHDSWDRTASASYVDPNTHQKVSLGRDVISELSNYIPGLERGTPVFKITSGLVDGIFDMNVGGTELLGLAGAANSAEGLGGVLGDYFPGKAPQTSEDFDNLLNSFSGGNVRRAFRDIANKSAGEIAMTSAYKPIAQQHALLTALGNASTEDEVADVFRNVIRTHELTFMDKLPTLSATRVPFQFAHEAMGDSIIPGVQKLYRATSRLPESYDELAKLWTAKEFDPTSAVDDGTIGIARTALFTESRSTAASIATEFANASPADKIRIWKNLQLSTLINFAGYHGYTLNEYLQEAFDDPEVRDELNHAINQRIEQGMFGKGAYYGLDDKANNISLVRDTETGATHAAAITANQTGKFEYLDLAKVRRMGQILGGKELRARIGGLDDFAYDHITAPVFKRWVLMSPSYALHIALAELIPNSLRLGIANVVRSKLELSAAQIGLKVEDGEQNAVEGLLYKLMRGVQKVSPDILTRNSEQRMGYLTDFLVDHDGATIDPALSSGHNYADEILPRDEKSVSLLRRAYFDSGIKPAKLGDNFGIFGTGDVDYVNRWQAALRESANDDAAQLAASRLMDEMAAGRTLEQATDKATTDVADFLRNSPGKDRNFFLRSLPNITSYPEGIERPPDMDQFDEWAAAVVKKVRGEIIGQDGTVNTSLLGHIRNGELVDDSELDNIPVKSRPLNVKGRLAIPSGDPSLQRIANWGFRRVLNPMVNFLSREPIAAAEYIKQRELLQDAVDSGILDEETAKIKAETATMQSVIKNVHNLTDRTQWTVTFRNWAPFYFAQEQAYRRMGRLLAEDPAAFRKYQLMITNMHDVGQVFSGKNGQGYLVLPGTGWLTSGAVFAAARLGIPVNSASPVGMGWNLSSSSVIFPLSAGFRPDVGPMVSIPVSAFADFFPETVSPVLKSDLSAASSMILGPTATEPIYEQMVPNTIVQRLLTAFMPGFNSRSFNSTMMQVLATLDYEGKIPPPNAPYTVQQTFIDRVRWQTRILYMTKAIVGAFSAVSPELTNQIYNQFSSEVTAEINKHKSVPLGVQAFITAHPDATPFTVWQSSEASGVSIPSSVGAEKWINDNYNLITQYPNAALLLMPMNVGTKFNASVYNEQIAQGLRTKLDPEQVTESGTVPSYVESLYTAAGNAIVFHWIDEFKQQTAGMSGSAKYDADQAFYGNNTLGSGTLGRYGQQNPVWWKWWQSDQKDINRGLAIQQMQKLLASPEAPKSTIADNTRILLAGYKEYEKQITTLTTDNASSSQQTAAKDAWSSYLSSVVKADPDMINVVTGLFMDTTVPTTTQTNIANNTTPGVFNAKSWNSAP